MIIGITNITLAHKLEIKEYYKPILVAAEPEYQIRLLDNGVLVSLVGQYDSLTKFLTDFALDPPSNRFGNKTSPLIDEGEDKPLTVSTIHPAKGQALARYSLRSNEFCFPIHSPLIISGGDKAWVVTSRSPDTLQSMEFGYTSEVSQKRMDMLNLRTDKVERKEDERKIGFLLMEKTVWYADRGPCESHHKNAIHL